MVIYRIYCGPYQVGKVDLTYRKGEVRRGEKIRVTPEEAEQMDKLRKQWANPDEPVMYGPSDAPSDLEVKVTRKKSRKRQTKGE